MSGRGGKSTGKYKNWINIRIPGDDNTQNMDVEKYEWKTELLAINENVNVVIIPRDQQNPSLCSKRRGIRKVDGI